MLASQPLFLPADGGFSPSEQAQLSALLAAARAHGYPIRVALIATRADLGSVTALWSMPASYAEFLGQELSLVFHGTLLVVMPDGFGVVHVGRAGGAAAGDGAAGSRGPRRATPMVAAGGAIAAVRDLAAAAGRRLRGARGDRTTAGGVRLGVGVRRSGVVAGAGRRRDAGRAGVAGQPPRPAAGTPASAVTG